MVATSLGMVFVTCCLVVCVALLVLGGAYIELQRTLFVGRTQRSKQQRDINAAHAASALKASTETSCVWNGKP